MDNPCRRLYAVKRRVSTQITKYKIKYFKWSFFNEVANILILQALQLLCPIEIGPATSFRREADVENISFSNNWNSVVRNELKGWSALAGFLFIQA